MNNKEYINKFKRCILEYTNAAGSFSVDEEGEEDMAMGGDPNAMGGDPSMGGDPNAMGGDPSMGGGPGMGGDPNAMGGDPSMGGDPNAMGGDPGMGGDPSMGGSAQGPEGFQPQGVDPNSGLNGMGGDPNANGDPNAMGGDPSMGGDPNGEGEDVEEVDVDELINAQKSAEEKIDKMNDRFAKLMGAVETLIKQNQERDSRERDELSRFKDEMEKRNPSPMQRMTMRSTKSAPYAMSPNEYMNNYAPDNYSAEDDNNGADDPQYQITKDQIDSFTDYPSIARELDIEHQGLRDILGF